MSVGQSENMIDRLQGIIKPVNSLDDMRDLRTGEFININFPDQERFSEFGGVQTVCCSWEEATLSLFKRKDVEGESIYEYQFSRDHISSFRFKDGVAVIQPVGCSTIRSSCPQYNDTKNMLI